MLKGKRMDVSTGTKSKGGTQPSFLWGQGTSGHMDTSLRPIFLVNDGGRGYLKSKNEACFPTRAIYQSLLISSVLSPEGPSAPHSCLAKPFPGYVREQGRR